MTLQQPWAAQQGPGLHGRTHGNRSTLGSGYDERLSSGSFNTAVQVGCLLLIWWSCTGSSESFWSAMMDLYMSWHLWVLQFLRYLSLLFGRIRKWLLLCTAPYGQVAAVLPAPVRQASCLSASDKDAPVAAGAALAGWQCEAQPGLVPAPQSDPQHASCTSPSGTGLARPVMCLLSALQIAKCQARWQHMGPDLFNQLRAPDRVTTQVWAWWHAYSIALPHQHLHAYAHSADLK